MARYLIWPRFVVALFLIVAVSGTPAQAQPTPLASWNDGPTRQAIVEFVRITTDKANPGYVPPEDRIATFDQDGTCGLSIRSSPRRCSRSTECGRSLRLHPEWKTEEPFKTVLSGGPEGLGISVREGLDRDCWSHPCRHEQ